MVLEPTRCMLCGVRGGGWCWEGGGGVEGGGGGGWGGGGGGGEGMGQQIQPDTATQGSSSALVSER